MAKFFKTIVLLIKIVCQNLVGTTYLLSRNVEQKVRTIETKIAFRESEIE